MALSGVIAAIHARGWCDGTGGNFSCVSRKEPLELLMAPSGVDKGSIQPHDLILVNGEAQVIEGSGAASAETLLHLEIVKRTGAAAVLHTHSQAATLLSRRALKGAEGMDTDAAVRIQGLEMLKGLAGLRSHDCSIAIPVLANDQDLRRLSQTASAASKRRPTGCSLPVTGSTPGATTSSAPAVIWKFSSSCWSRAGENSCCHHSPPGHDAAQIHTRSGRGRRQRRCQSTDA